MKHLVHRDQVHRDVYYDPLSTALIDTPQMQRLGRVYQLGFAHLVYRGGTHTRLSHVMGAAKVAGDIVDSLRKNYESAIKERALPQGAILPDKFLPFRKGSSASIEDRWDVLLYFVRWSALLHDIGHIPMGHTLEDEFAEIYKKHDSFDSPRIAYLWNEIAPGQTSPIKKVLLNKNLYPDSFSKLDISPQDVWRTVLLTCLYKETAFVKEFSGTNDNFHSIYFKAYTELNGNLFSQYMADIVADTICADYVDYLQRDTLNVGLDPVHENRIFRSYFVGSDIATGNLRMALSLVDKKRKPKLSICTAAKNMVRHRFDLAEIIYYHKTKVSASAMLAKVFSLIDKPQETGNPRITIGLADIEELAIQIISKKNKARELKADCIPDSLLHPSIGDETLLFWLQQKAWDKLLVAVEEKNAVVTKNCLQAISLIQSITERRLYKVALAIDSTLIGRLASTQKESIEQLIKKFITKYRDGKVEKTDSKEPDRDELERLMGEAAGWPSGAFLAYVPGRKSQAKGIETGALDNGKVITLGKHDTVKEDVQILNLAYENLWRFLIYVNPDYSHNYIELSRAVDRFLKDLFPDINLRNSVSVIQQACWFPYIPEHLRDAAQYYIEMNSGDSSKANWNVFYEAENAVQGTTVPPEHAERAMLLNYLPGYTAEQIKKSAFGLPNALSKKIEEQEAQLLVAESLKGIPKIEGKIMAISKIADGIMKPEQTTLF